MSTNYLKNFAEGEVIKASETNANNQFLLEKISDNASDIQSTVNSQIANIKSELATAKKSFETALETKFDISNLNEIFISLMPNYKAGKTITSGYIAESNGWIYAFLGGVERTASKLYINGYEVGGSSNTDGGYVYASTYAFVTTGDKVTFGTHSGVKFFPMKGAN